MIDKVAIEGGTPEREEFLPFGKPCIGEDEILDVVQTMRSGWIGTGGRVIEFERAFADYIGCKYAVAVSSCTAALHLAVVVSGLGPGDEIITTPMTFAATATAIIHAGARPVFVDIEPDTLNINPGFVGRAITERTKAIIPVHFGGLPCKMDEIAAIAQERGIIVIEDAAHAIGARYRGKMVGNLGNLTCFSFYPNKNMTTAEGGMVTTDSEMLAEHLRILRLHGMSTDAWKRYQSKELVTSEVMELGFKYNMTDLQAVIGIHQLKKVERFLEVRERYAAMYDEAFRGFKGVRMQPRPTDIEKDRHGLHLYILMLESDAFRVQRDHIVRALRAENIGVGVHYKALHIHKYFRETLGYDKGDFPVAERVSDETMSLPLSPAMTETDVNDVIRATRKVLEYYRR